MLSKRLSAACYVRTLPLDNAFFSDNWSKIPELLNTLASKRENLESFVRLDPGWIFTLLLGIDQDELGHKLIRHYRQVDPLDYSNALADIPFLMSQGQLDSALVSLKRLKSENSKIPLLDITELSLAVQMGDYKGAFEKAKTKLAPDDPLVLMLRIWNGEQDEVRKFISELSPERLNSVAPSPSQLDLVSLVYIYALLGDQKKANEIAHNLDAKILGPQLLINEISSHAGNFPFDLTATPNLSSRLQEVGIDLKEYHQKNLMKHPAHAQ